MDYQRVEPNESEMLSEMTREMGWDIFYDQVDSGRFDGSIEFAGSDHTQFFRERYSRSVCIHGAVPQGMATFVIATPPTNHVSFRGEAVTPQTICTFMPGDEGTLSVSASGEFLTCCLNAERLEDSLQALHHTSLAKVLYRTGLIHVPAIKAARLQAVIQSATDAVPDRGQILDPGAADAAVEQQAFAALCRALMIKEPASSSQLAARNHWRCVRKARELIEAHLGNLLRMEMLCRHTGVSERTLETAFREVTGHSPLQFIKARRLNVARHKLLTAHTQEISVKEAALSSGFWHLGHFSRDYLAQFGELPSTTLAQR